MSKVRAILDKGPIQDIFIHKPNTSPFCGVVTYCVTSRYVDMDMDIDITYKLTFNFKQKMM